MAAEAGFDGTWFRQVLGNFPTGVAVVTGIDTGIDTGDGDTGDGDGDGGRDGGPTGMAVGSFTSASLDPPLVAFFPDRRSTSWPRVAASGRFCVNILGADQEDVCRTFAVRGGDKFAELSWRPAPWSGSPILDGVVAWIDCEVDRVDEAGDHWLVLGRVRALDVARAALPLVFFQGGYGRFSPASLAAWEGDLAVQLRTADLARPQMEALADDLGVECVASAIAGEEIVLVANAGGHRSPLLPTQVGQRIPFLPPVGTVFAAWAPDAARAAWLGRVGPDAAPRSLDELDATLAAVRRLGYSVGRGDGWHAEFRAALTKADPHDPTDATHEAVRDLIRALPPSYESPEVDVTPWGEVPEDAASNDAVAGAIRTLSAPVFGRDGSVLLVLSVINISLGPLAHGTDETAAALLAAAAAVTAALGGRAPL